MKNDRAYLPPSLTNGIDFLLNITLGLISSKLLYVCIVIAAVAL
jgi:hypothetical protein